MSRSTAHLRVAHPAVMPLGKAIEKAMQQAPDIEIQEVLADRLNISQTTLSRYINGRLAVSVARVAQIEAICGVPRGQILAWSGYVDLEALARQPVRRAKRPELAAAAEGAKGGRVRTGKRTARPTADPEPGPP